mgnify:CR=1 FL=1
MTKKTIAVLGFAAMMTGVFYTILNNKVSGTGYVMKGLERSIKEEQRSIEQIQYKIAVELSSKKLVERSAHLGLVTPASVEYIRQDGSVVALK